MPVNPQGILVGKQAEIFYDLAEKIRNSGAFGSSTVLDEPDLYASDPFVQTAIALTSSDSDCWLALEFLQNQLDPENATGRFLNEIHLSRYGINKPDLSTAEARALIRQLRLNGVKITSPEAAVMQLASVKFAKTYYSKPRALVPYLNAGENMLVITPNPTTPIIAGTIAQKLFENIGDGFFNWVGDTQDIYEYEGHCYPYFYQLADRVVIAVKIYGNLKDCTDANWADVANALIEKANCALQFDYGATIDGQALLQLIGATPNVNINRIEIQRRPKPLTPIECLADAPSLTFTDCSGITTTELWASDKVCGYAQGEIWCNDFVDCMVLKPWEYATFHPSFFEFINEPSPC
jgi:hypothetical protein